MLTKSFSKRSVRRNQMQFQQAIAVERLAYTKNMSL